MVTTRETLSRAVLGMLFALGGCSGPADGTGQDASSPGDGAGDAEEEIHAPGPSRLRAEGTRIVDAAGAEVRLRGVNLGGWMFHETWITLSGPPLHARILDRAVEEDLVEEVTAAARAAGTTYGTDPAVIHVCPADGPEWLPLFQEALAGELGAEAAAAFVAGLEPALCDDSDRGLRALLEERFGPDGRDQLLDSFQEAWLREADIAWLADHGFNVVRVPIGYRSLMTGPDADRPEALAWNDAALARIDALLDWCRDHGIWAIIDIQEAPGGQNTYAGDAGLYDDPLMQDLTVELWETLSDRYRDRDEVAAYSLLAEPYGAPDAAARDAMYDRLVTAIRARGDDHLLVIHDGFMGMESLPDPAAFGWEDVIYSTHLFEWTVTGPEGYAFILELYRQAWALAREAQGVPFYVGSFSTFRDEPWAYQAAGDLVAWMEEGGWSWSLWTYKRMDDPATVALFELRSAWGLRRDHEGPFDRPDPFSDSFEELEAKLAATAGLELGPNAALLEALTSWKER
ncbi:MAG: cellulase family glycosylhydrolase [Deltaproteobacteria bacterium]|nr:cellulase family glycosylhydrolase [Deltaproteobacteria bacterium]